MWSWVHSGFDGSKLVGADAPATVRSSNLRPCAGLDLLVLEERHLDIARAPLTERRRHCLRDGLSQIAEPLIHRSASGESILGVRGDEFPPVLASAYLRVIDLTVQPVRYVLVEYDGTPWRSKSEHLRGEGNAQLNPIRRQQNVKGCRTRGSVRAVMEMIASPDHRVDRTTTSRTMMGVLKLASSGAAVSPVDRRQVSECNRAVLGHRARFGPQQSLVVVPNRGLVAKVGPFTCHGMRRDGDLDENPSRKVVLVPPVYESFRASLTDMIDGAKRTKTAGHATASVIG